MAWDERPGQPLNLLIGWVWDWGWGRAFLLSTFSEWGGGSKREVHRGTGHLPPVATPGSTHRVLAFHFHCFVMETSQTDMDTWTLAFLLWLTGSFKPICGDFIQSFRVSVRLWHGRYRRVGSKAKLLSWSLLQTCFVVSSGVFFLGH